MKYFSLLLTVTSLFFSIAGQSGTLLTDQTIVIAGVTRSYHLFEPNTPENAPVVLLFHGHSGTHSELLGLDGEIAPYSIWLEIAEAENIILAIPNGFYTSENSKGWNDCRADAPTNSTADDVLFISTLIDTIIATYSADANRVYANGTSNGGHFCIRLAEELPEKVAAFATIVAANAVNSECMTATLPVSALFINGTEDPFLPYQGGQMINNRGEVYSTAATIEYWINRNGTDTNPVVTALPNTFPGDNCEVTKYEYPNGDNNSCVVLYEVAEGGHTEPSVLERYNFPAVPLLLGRQNGDIEMAEEVWAFFANKTNTVTFIHQPLLESSIKITPNPVTDQLKLEAGDRQNELQRIGLFAATGQYLGNYSLSGNALDVSNLRPGVYFLRLVFPEGIITKKFVKK